MVTGIQNNLKDVGTVPVVTRKQPNGNWILNYKWPGTEVPMTFGLDMKFTTSKQVVLALAKSLKQAGMTGSIKPVKVLP